MEVSQSVFSKSLVELPFDSSKGKVFRSVMPGSISGKGKSSVEDDITTWKTSGISSVVLLVSDHEGYFGTGGACKSLKETYQQEGFQVLQFPIPDRDVPDNSELSKVLSYIDLNTSQGSNIAIHCVGGKGRTGLVIACLARKRFNISGKEALDWVRNKVPGAVETKGQKQFVASFLEEENCTIFEKSLTFMPFGFETGKIYRCMMPGYKRVEPDISGDIESLKSRNISHLLLLASQKECETITGLNLKEKYESEGVNVLELPIRDFGVPTPEELSFVLEEMQGLLSQDCSLAVHCMGGNGRTGLVLACLASKAFELPVKEAIAWVREFVPKAVESKAQEKFIADFIEIKEESAFSKSLTRLPFELKKGAIYRSVMPGSFSSKAKMEMRVMRDILTLKAQNITHVLMLATEQECFKVTGLDLMAIYQKYGINVCQFPIADGKPPEKKALNKIIASSLDMVSSGKRVAIHCLGGIGRTGLVAACMAQTLLGKSGEESVDWIRDVIAGAIQTPEQENFVLDFQKEDECSVQ